MNPRGRWTAGVWARRTLPGTLVLLGLVPGGCGGPPPVELEPGQRARAAELGRAAADTLALTLGSRLATALSQGGPVQALVFCSGRAQDLTDSVAAALPSGIRVGRTSLKPRNPANAPDAVDRAVLLDFDEAVASSAGPPAEDVRRGADGEVRYYRPLVVTDLCLQCHGPVEELAPAVRDVLRARYPDDRAVGYHVGDVRGAIRVRIPLAALDPRGPGGG